ncbi:hypothetical protein J6590_051123 [Homalodisca vitripennis]|nr:hypothetical protein J6590_051123 [Homalodisca vitripennis]
MVLCNQCQRGGWYRVKGVVHKASRNRVISWSKSALPDDTGLWPGGQSILKYSKDILRTTSYPRDSRLSGRDPDSICSIPETLSFRFVTSTPRRIQKFALVFFWSTILL